MLHGARPDEAASARGLIAIQFKISVSFSTEPKLNHCQIHALSESVPPGAVMLPSFMAAPLL